jgi:hypothetical protein
MQKLREDFLWSSSGEVETAGVRDTAESPLDQSNQRTAVWRLFEETRRRLVETGTRNRLVHVNRQSRRSNTLDIINERSNDVYGILVNSG